MDNNTHFTLFDIQALSDITDDGIGVGLHLTHPYHLFNTEKKTQL